MCTAATVVCRRFIQHVGMGAAVFDAEGGLRQQNQALSRLLLEETDRHIGRGARVRHQRAHDLATCRARAEQAGVHSRGAAVAKLRAEY